MNRRLPSIGPWWRVCADVAVPRWSDGVGVLRAWLRGSAGSVAEGLAEYAFEEAGLLAGGVSARAQAAAIEALDRDAAALSARVDALASRG
jgi:ubiquinone biosynthesis protein UbiJ